MDEIRTRFQKLLDAGKGTGGEIAALMTLRLGLPKMDDQAKREVEAASDTFRETYSLSRGDFRDLVSDLFDLTPEEQQELLDWLRKGGGQAESGTQEPTALAPKPEGNPAPVLELPHQAAPTGAAEPIAS